MTNQNRILPQPWRFVVDLFQPISDLGRAERSVLRFLDEGTPVIFFDEQRNVHSVTARSDGFYLDGEPENKSNSAIIHSELFDAVQRVAKK